jgi:hypothetical protein
MVRTAVHPPQSIADDHTLIAQRYSGYFVGHPYRAAQQRVDRGAIQVEYDKVWKEPAVVSDECDFCRGLSDEDVLRRVEGYQHAMDIEVLRPYSVAYAQWLATGNESIPERENVTVDGITKTHGVSASQHNRRKFIEMLGDKIAVPPVSMIDLPHRLKRKLCIEWNHLYLEWLESNPDVSYDFDRREFFRESGAPDPPKESRQKEWWQLFSWNDSPGGAP